jgi:Concanavalin A-like lectin/glucanases superfamily
VPYRKARAWELTPDVPLVDPNDPIGQPLVGWWPFDSVFNGTTPNLGWRGASQTLMGGSGTTPTLIRGRIGSALQFAGNQWVQVVNGALPTQLQLSRNFTISAWINPTSVSGNQAVYCVWNGPYLRLNGSSLDFLCSFVSGIISGGTIVAGIWQHVAVTVGSGSTATMTIFINGKSVASTSSSQTFSFTSYTAIGGQTSDGTGITEGFTGTIDDVRVIAQALPQSEIYRIYSDTSGGLGLIKPRGRRIISGAAGGASFVPYTSTPQIGPILAQ